MTELASDADALRDALSEKSEQLQQAIVARFQERLSGLFGSGTTDLSFSGEDDGIFSWALSRTEDESASFPLDGLGGKGVARQIVGLKRKTDVHRRSARFASLMGADVRRNVQESRISLRHALVSRREELRSDLKQAVLDAFVDGDIFGESVG